jgi:glycosyltransferase involved in cell wall biosynthesis
MTAPPVLAQAQVFFITAAPLASYMTRRPHHVFRRLAGLTRVVNISSSRQRGGEGIFRRLPGDRFPPIQALNRTLYRRHLRKLAEALDSPPVMWVWGPPRSWLWEGMPRRALVYELSDYIPGFYAREDILPDLERTMAMADVVFAVSRPLLRWAKKLNGNAFLVQNGVDPEVFLPAARAEKSSLGYWGALASWVRMELLEAVADALPEVELRVAGRAYSEAARALEELVKRPNVRYFGELSYEGLPEFLAPVSVGLVPFDTGRLGNSTSPLKIYEAFAAGAGVVSTDIDEAIFHQEKGVLEVADGPEGFVEAVRRMMAERNPRRLSEKAGENSWDARFKKILSALGRIP